MSAILWEGGEEADPSINQTGPEVSIKNKGGGGLVTAKYVGFLRALNLDPVVSPVKHVPSPWKDDLHVAEGLFPEGSALLQMSIRRGPSLWT